MLGTATYLGAALSCAILVAGCEVEETLTMRTETETVGAPLTAADYERIRGEVLGDALAGFKGMRPPRGYRGCFARGLEAELTDVRLQDLIDLHAEEGRGAAIAALNELAAPIGQSCGGRRHLPKLDSAARGVDLSP